MKECCKSLINLTELKTDDPDKSTLQCLMCGCKHYSLRVDPGVLGYEFPKKDVPNVD